MFASDEISKQCGWLHQHKCVVGLSQAAKLATYFAMLTFEVLACYEVSALRIRPYSYLMRFLPVSGI